MTKVEKRLEGGSRLLVGTVVCAGRGAYLWTAALGRGVKKGVVDGIGSQPKMPRLRVPHIRFKRSKESQQTTPSASSPLFQSGEYLHPKGF